MARRLANILIWLALTAEVEGYIFHDKWATPLTWLGSLLFKGLPGLHVIPWDFLVLVTLLVARRSAGREKVRAVERSIALTFASLVALWCWGVLRGGSAYETIWQLHGFIVGLCVALLVIATCKTRAHVVSLGKVVVFAALYRACVLLAFYFAVAKDLPEQLPTLTDHSDSVLFVSGLVVLWITALEKRTSSSISWLCVGAVLLLTAIVLNNRRIAWLDLAVTIFMTYVLLPKGKMKRLLSMAMLAASPLVVVYIAIGWGNPTGIFKPVGAISTMFGTKQDTSSIMRDIENYNLLRTLATNPVLGLGWGKEYIEDIVAYDISKIFPQYRYQPHNSLLGVLAFTGFLGFAGIWQIVPVACFLHARVARMARDPIYRIAALSTLLAFMTVVVQMWGDVGFTHLMVNTVLGVGIGLAARLPVLGRVWPGYESDISEHVKVR